MSDYLNTINGIHYLTGQAIQITVDSGRIANITSIEQQNCTTKILAPGLVDLQINGYMGIDFNKRPLEHAEWQSVLKHLSAAGVTTFYPTIITNSYEQLVHIFEQSIEYLEAHPLVKERIGGFHLEGPYISMEDGPRGAHAKEHIRKPDWEEFCALQEKACGMIKLLTLSPEWDGSGEFIRKVTASGVKVAIGHTNAATEQIKEAVQAGAQLSTHLGNGAHVTLPRHPNYIWDQLAEESLWASVISDGSHLPDNVLRVINKVKREKMLLVSDSVALAGLEPGDYEAPVGGEVTLTANGRLHLKNQPKLLAGSAQNLLQGVSNLVNKSIISIGDALNKASVYPAKFMELPSSQGIEIGAPADLTLISTAEKEWSVEQTFKNGKLIYQKGSE